MVDAYTRFPNSVQLCLGQGGSGARCWQMGTGCQALGCGAVDPRAVCPGRNPVGSALEQPLVPKLLPGNAWDFTSFCLISMQPPCPCVSGCGVVRTGLCTLKAQSPGDGSLHKCSDSFFSINVIQLLELNFHYLPDYSFPRCLFSCLT